MFGPCALPPRVPELVAKHVGYLRTEKKDLRRVVDPDEQDHDRRCRAISGLKSLRSDVQLIASLRY